VGSYECGCIAGFLLQSDLKNCGDRDECSLNIHNCEHICANTFGSFVCFCNPGFALNGNGFTCDDVDECTAGGGPFIQTCNRVNGSCSNTFGSFQCACNPGFILAPNLYDCLDINECPEDLNTATCNPVNGTCKNTWGSFQCGCRAGFTLAVDAFDCDDVDECIGLTHNCNSRATCYNTFGSFYCGCNDGYYGNGLNCTGCPIGTFDDSDGNAVSITSCKLCQTTTAAIYGPTSIMDCTVTATTSSTGKAYFSDCICPQGYELSANAGEAENRTCVDVNECARDPDICIFESICINTCGSYNCSRVWIKEGSLTMNNQPTVPALDSQPLNHSLVFATSGGETISFTVRQLQYQISNSYKVTIGCPAGGCYSPAYDVTTGEFFIGNELGLMQECLLNQFLLNELDIIDQVTHQNLTRAPDNVKLDHITHALALYDGAIIDIPVNSDRFQNNTFSLSFWFSLSNISTVSMLTINPILATFTFRTAVINGQFLLVFDVLDLFVQENSFTLLLELNGGPGDWHHVLLTRRATTFTLTVLSQ